MLLKITSVDHYGYNGRECHPDDSDIGQVVLVLGLQTMALNSHTEEVDVFKPTRGPLPVALSEEGEHAVRFAIEDREAAVLQHCWICGTHDGRVLWLMDHEVELVRS